MNTKALIFDCFGVLVAETSRRFQAQYLADSPDRLAQYRALSQRSDLGQMDYADFLKSAAKLAGITQKQASQHFWDAPRNAELLNYIKAQLKSQFQIALLSNLGRGRLEGVLAPADLALFDLKILSFELGIVKPNPQIYQLAAEKLELSPADCLFIDDSPENIAAAQALGMQPILYQNFPQFLGELEKIK